MTWIWSLNTEHLSVFCFVLSYLFAPFMVDWYGSFASLTRAVGSGPMSNDSLDLSFARGGSHPNLDVSSRKIITHRLNGAVSFQDDERIKAST